MRAFREPRPDAHGDSGSCFNSNAYLDTHTDADPNADPNADADARCDTDTHSNTDPNPNPNTNPNPNPGACFNSVDHANAEHSVNVPNWFAAGDDA